MTFFAAAVFGTPLTAAASPFIPNDDKLVLQSDLPTTDPRVREMRGLAARLRGHPEDLPTAMRLASRQLAMGVAESDPRFVGYAQATLAHWWSDPARRVPLRVLRARILQAQHDFAGAAEELHAALREQPGDVDALFLLASVEEVRGELAGAKAACDEFGRLRPGLEAGACAADIGSLTGAAAPAYATLSEALRTAPPSRDQRELIWPLTVLAELAIRIDKPAEPVIEQARAIDPRNVYLLTVYADYLLDQGRGARVLELLSGLERIDTLYLRLVLAAQQTGDRRFREYRDGMAERLAAARLQGDTLHLRDASIFALRIERDAPRAVIFARENWKTHRSPADARALAAAAVGAGDTAGIETVRTWVATTKLEDHVLNRLLDQVPARPN